MKLSKSLPENIFPKSLRIIDFEITGDIKRVDNGLKYTPEISEQLALMHHLSESGKKRAEKQLKAAVEKYPDVPAFKNYLSNYYVRMGRRQKGYKINHQIVSEHPDYLLGKINLAAQMLSEERFDEIPKILGQTMELKALYPHRKVFHISEYNSFLHIACMYEIATGNLDAAETRLNNAKKMYEETNFLDINLLDKLAKEIMFSRMTMNVAEYEEDEDFARAPVEREIDETLQTDKKPVFQHSEIEALYHNSLLIDHKILKKILALPRKSLIQDLRVTLNDGIRRYNYFEDLVERSEKWDQNKLSFPLHAMFLLTELKAGEALPDIFEFLSMPLHALDFWLGDHQSETVQHFIYHLGKDRLDALTGFMKERNINAYSKGAVISAVRKMAEFDPEIRDVAIEWYREILEYYWENLDDDDLTDSEVISFLINDCIEFGCVSMLPLFKKFWDQQITIDFITGTWEEIVKDIHEPPKSLSAYTVVYDSIFDHYNEITSTWSGYLSKEQLAEKNKQLQKRIDKLNAERNTSKVETEDYSFLNEEQQSEKNTLKIGRNDPCPCGSGKKYKKCCLQKTTNR